MFQADFDIDCDSRSFIVFYIAHNVYAMIYNAEPTFYIAWVFCMNGLCVQLRNHDNMQWHWGQRAQYRNLDSTMEVLILILSRFCGTSLTHTFQQIITCYSYSVFIRCSHSMISSSTVFSWLIQIKLQKPWYDIVVMDALRARRGQHSH